MSTLKSLFLCIITAAAASSCAAAEQPCITARYTYLIKMGLPKAIHNSEPWCAYYKGKQIRFDGNLGHFVENSFVSIFSLIVTLEVDAHDPAELIHRIRRDSTKAIRWFDLTLVMNKDGQWQWNIEELDRTALPLTLPDHAIFLRFDPACIDQLLPPEKAHCPITATHEGGSCTFELPKITLRGKQSTFTEAAHYAQLARLDVHHLHAQDRLITKRVFPDSEEHRSSACLITVDCS